MMYRLIIIGFLLLISTSSSFAEEKKEPEQDRSSFPTLKEEDIPTNLKFIDLAHVKKVIDPYRMELDDGRIIYLASIDVPDMDSYDAGPVSVAAKELLSDLFVGRNVRIYQLRQNTEARINRMDQHMAYVIDEKDNIWAQGALLSRGLARVRTTLLYRDLASEMLALEKQARQNVQNEENTGEKEQPVNLWHNEENQIYTPETALDAPHRFQIVEGEILKVATVKNTIYLNFGNDWKNDFTVTMDSTARRLFSKEGFDPLSWTGKTVRVRGWIDEYNGPYIELDHPQRIEFIEPTDSLQNEPINTPLKEPDNALPDAFQH
jgi:micrococcal nuclease